MLSAPPAPRESETRVQWPARDRGKGSGGSYIGGETKEEDANKVQRWKNKLAAYEAECVEGMRRGFDMQVECANRPHMTRAEKTDLVHADYLKKLGVGWQGDFVPEALSQSNEKLFKVVQPKSPDQVVPTFTAFAQGTYAPLKCETHDDVARIMCLPCMTYAAEKGLWGTIQQPDTRKSPGRERKLSAFALLSGVGNFKSGHCWTKEHARCMLAFCRVPSARDAAMEAILSASKAHAATGSTETDWLGFNTPLAADASLHFRLRCKVCQTDVGPGALGVDDAMRELEAHLVSHPKKRAQAQATMHLFASPVGEPTDEETVGSGEDDAMGMVDGGAADEDAEEEKPLKPVVKRKACGKRAAGSHSHEASGHHGKAKPNVPAGGMNLFKSFFVKQPNSNIGRKPKSAK